MDCGKSESFLTAFCPGNTGCPISCLPVRTKIVSAVHGRREASEMPLLIPD